MKTPRKILVAVAMTLATASFACMWDRDTLAAEAKGHMDFVGAVTGRFDRNPPLYYEMRLQRVAAEIKAHPDRLGLYDDAGVAAERLEKYDEAIQWMARKKAAMKPLDMNDQASKDAWYRYYSNLGTFISYDLFAPIKTKEHIARLNQAIDLLKKGLKINPNAHFGREIYQVDLIDWVRDVKTGIATDQFWPTGAGDGASKADKEKAITGLCGLVQLGRAWKSVDVFRGIRNLCSEAGNAYLADLADLRAKELEMSGEKSIFKREEGDGDFEKFPMWMPEPDQRAFDEKEFRRLRTEADQIADKRAAFMVARMKQGKHPDTDPDFWNGYQTPDPQVIDDIGYLQTQHGKLEMLALGALGICCVAPVTLVVVWLAVRMRKRRAAAM